jgi:hypothetical protein
LFSYKTQVRLMVTRIVTTIRMKLLSELILTSSFLRDEKVGGH